MNKRIRIAAVAAAVAVACAVTVYAAYDSSKDPLVSVSYLTEVFGPQLKADLDSELHSSVNTATNQLKSEIESAISAAKEELRQELSSKIENDYGETFDAIQEQLDVLSNSYEAVTLKTNNRVTANAACEFVLLSGSATVRASAANSGIIDCTDGVILYDGQNIPLNHKLLVPENGDGRGFLVTGNAQVLIRGGYTVG